MKDFDPDLSLSENWQTADPLDFAWFGYAPAELKERLQNAGSHPGRSATFRRLMEAEVRLQIGRSHLIAFGILIAPTLEEEPRQIPAALFQAHSTSIDWDKATVVGLGRTFEEVRVCWSGIAATELPTPARPSDIHPLSKARGSGGRRSLYPEARQVLEILYEEPAYRAMSAFAILDVFNAKYLELHRPPNGRLSPVSLRALQNYVRAYRQERAQTGKN